MKAIRRTGRDERGIALVITLLLVSITTALGLVMYLSVSSDMFIGGYYRNFRGAFYAADSGLNIARAQLVNQVLAQVPTTFAVPPLADPTAIANAAMTYLTQNYGNYISLQAGQAATSWGESFKVTGVTLALASGSPTVTSRDSSNNPTGYSYIYNYSLTSMGTAQGTEQSTVGEKGSISFVISATARTTSVSFAAFGAFVDNYPPCTGPLTPGTMTGPMFTNGAWQFRTGGSYIFTDPVGQVEPDADYWFGSSCQESATPSYRSGRQTIAPTFQGGLALAQNPIPLPTNEFSQKRAILDGMGLNSTNPTNTELNAALRNASGTPYPVGGATSGVYLAYTNSGGANTMTGGGIYVEGSAQVMLSPSGTSAQVYTITQGTLTTTITSDPLAVPPPSWNCPAGTRGTTSITSGVTTTNICSVPMNNITSQPATMLYVNGALTGLSGPGQGQGAVQDGSQITITANGDITATGDVLYKTEPVTVTQNQVVTGTTPPCCVGAPADTLIPGGDTNQVLGIFTTTGNFNLNTSQTGANIQIDGSIATISQGGAGGILNQGPPINTFNNIGGQIQSSIYNAAIGTENIFFDRRFTSRPGFAPPWFPSTTVTQGGALSTNVTSTIQRVQWLNQTTVQ